MNAISVGPLVLDGGRFAGVAALLLFLLVAEITARRQGGRLTGEGTKWAGIGLVAWILAARAGFVVANWPDYGARPLDVLRVWQGGFLAPVGWAAGGAVLLIALLRKPRGALKPLAFGGIAALLLHGAVTAALPQPGATLPRMQLIALDGSAVQLAGRDQPVVLNLWATWCPPCRREMPMMTELAADTPDVDFVFANQGESVDEVLTFLKTEDLPQAGMARDPQHRLMAELNAIGLPATLVFDARGRLVGAHTGEVSRAALTRMIATAK